MTVPKNGPSQPADPAAHAYSDVPCLGCGCLCDDIQVTLQRDSIQEAKGACEMGTDWFTSKIVVATQEKSCLVEGQSASVEEAIAAAGKIITGATYPLIFGLTSASNETTSAAVALADQLGAVLDLSLESLERAHVLAKQNVGDRTATLGFVHNHAKLSIFLCCDPVATHPRHLERYSVGVGTKLVTVDSRKTATSALAHRHIQISSGGALPAIQALRSLAQDKPIDESKTESATGIPMKVWRELHDMILKSDLTAVFFGGEVRRNSPDENVSFCESVLRWATEINCRMVTLPVGGMPNSGGAIDTLTWQTGFPFAVDFSARFPQFDPRRFSAETLLAQQSVDAILIVDSAEHVMFSRCAQTTIERGPTIVLGPQPYDFASQPNVWIPTTVTGIDAQGTVHRVDHVALRFRPLRRSTHSTSATILQRILNMTRL